MNATTTEIKEINFTNDKKDIKTICEYIDKQYFTVGKYLQNVLESNGTIKTARDFMEAQRGYTWDKCRASNLILTILMQHYCIPAIQVYRHDSTSQFRKVWDGQQRLTTIYLFIHDMLKLDMSKSRYPYIKIEGERFNTKDTLHGKIFSELPELWRDILLSYNLNIITMNNATDEMAEEFYTMVNEGVKTLKPIEIQKASMGAKTRKIFNKYLDVDWMLHVLKPSVILDNAGYEIMSHFVTLLVNNFEPIGLDKDNINETLYKYRESGLSEQHEAIISNVTDYLNTVFNILIENKKAADEQSAKKKPKNYATYHYKWLNKTNTVMLMYAAHKAIENNISAGAFANWVEHFFSNPTKAWNDASGYDGTKAVDEVNVNERIEIIDKEIKNLVEAASVTKSKTEVNDKTESA